MTTRKSPAKPAPRVWWVQEFTEYDTDYAHVLAYFAHKEDAELFSAAIYGIHPVLTVVRSRTLWYGQPNNPGYNE